MAKIIYDKEDSKAVNKHLVQDTIYDWVAKKYPYVGNSIILLAGKTPHASIKRTQKLSKYHFKVYLYEKNSEVYHYLKDNKIIEDINISLAKAQIPRSAKLYNNASHSIKIQDLDFCSTWCQNRNRALSRMYIPSDVLNTIHNRLHYMKQITLYDKVLIGTISTRNGVGKDHTIECLNDFCFQLGWNIVSVDGIKRGYPDGYDKGIKLKGSGTIHGNGGKYYAYEHDIKTSPLKQYTKPVNKFSIRLFTYTDTQPMLTFAIGFK